MGGTRNAYHVLVGNPEGKRHLEDLVIHGIQYEIAP
jgi:hypothetical protein